MKFKHLILATNLLLAFGVSSMAQKLGHIEGDYDRFEDKTLVQLDFMQITGGKYEGIHLNAAFKCPGNTQICKTEHFYLGILVVLKRERYDLPANLIVLADGERFPLGKMLRVQTIDMMPGWNIIGTSLLVHIPRDAFLKITAAKKVEMKLDDTEFELNSEHRTALYTFSTFAR